MNYSIIVVDDEECIRDLCSEVLPLWGYDVDTASDGFMAIEKVKKGNYNIVLTDIKMPNCDGLTVLEKVKLFNPLIEVIVMTGYGTVETAVDAMKKGAYDFVMKPLSLNQMNAVLKKCVEKIKLTSQNKELTEVNIKLKQLNEMKEKFIAITSHELRTPVCSIAGFIELLRYSLAGDMDDDPKSLLDDMEAIVQGLSDIVRDMHDLASIDAGDFKIHRENFDLIETIQNSTHEFLPVVRDRKININVNSQLDTFIYNGDRRRIKQLVRELLQNAVKFTPNEGKIEIDIIKYDNSIKIAFKDTGIGIPSDKLKNIFERFYEVQDSIFHSSSKVEFMGGGLGLGLSLVKEVVEKHGGTIIVDSHVNEGSTFIVTFPL